MSRPVWMPGVWQRGDTVAVKLPHRWVHPVKGTLLWEIQDTPEVRARVGKRWQLGTPDGHGMSICEDWIAREVPSFPAVCIKNGYVYLHGERLRPWRAEQVLMALKCGALFQKP